jgi:hypothetical protein
MISLGDISPLQLAQYKDEFIDSDGRETKGICNIGQGQDTGFSQAFLLTPDKIEAKHLEKELLKPLLKARNIQRWVIEYPEQMIILTDDSVNINKFPNIKNHLEFYTGVLERRQRVVTGQRRWYSFSFPQNLEIFAEKPKIVVPYLSPGPCFSLDTRGCFNDNGDIRAISIKPDWAGKITYEYLISLLNSRFVEIWFEKMGTRKKKNIEYVSSTLARIPVKVPGLDVQNEIGKIVKEIQKIASETKNPDIPEIKEKENEINKKIFEIYETNEEKLLNKQEFNEKTPV